MKSVLVVDDEKDIVEVISQALIDAHFEVVKAFDGDQALDLFKQKKEAISCILSDIHMPHLNGLEMLKKIRDLDRNVPFIFLTAKGCKESMQIALEHSAFDFIDKPVDLDYIVTTIKNAIEYYEQKKSGTYKTVLMEKLEKMLDDN